MDNPQPHPRGCGADVDFIFEIFADVDFVFEIFADADIIF